MDTTTTTAKGGLFKGWPVCIAAAYLTLCSGATTVLTYSMNGFLAANETISKTTPGNCTSIVNACSVVFAALISGIISKKSAKIVMTCTLILACIGQVIMMFVPSTTGLHLATAVLFGVCLVGVSKLGAPILMNKWFQHNRAVPMALVIAASSAVTIFSSLQGSLYEQYGKMGGYGLVLVICVIGVLVSLFFIKEDPHDIGELRDGRAWRESHGISMIDTDEKKEGVTAEETKAERSALLKNGKFWAFTLFCLVRMGVYAGSSAYITMIIVSRGFTPAQAGAALASLSLSSTVGRLTTPVISKVLRLGNITANSVAHVLAFLGCILIYFSSSLTLFNVAVMLVGYAYGLGFVSQTLALADLFPKANFTAAMGLFTTVIGFNFILPSIYGYVGAALDGNFSPIYLVLGICNIIFAVLVLLMRPKKIAQEAGEGAA